MAMRRPRIWVRLTVPEPKTGSALIPRPRYRRGKWNPLGSENHVRSHPTLVILARLCRKATLIELTRQVVYRPKIARLIQKWDQLSPAAKKAVSLADLLRYAGLAPADFIAEVLKIEADRGHIRVLTALQHIKQLPPDVELAIRREFTVAMPWRETK